MEIGVNKWKVSITDSGLHDILHAGLFETQSGPRKSHLFMQCNDKCRCKHGQIEQRNPPSLDVNNDSSKKLLLHLKPMSS